MTHTDESLLQFYHTLQFLNTVYYLLFFIAAASMYIATFIVVGQYVHKRGVCLIYKQHISLNF